MSESIITGREAVVGGIVYEVWIDGAEGNLPHSGYGRALAGHRFGNPLNGKTKWYVFKGRTVNGPKRMVEIAEKQIVKTKWDMEIEPKAPRETIDLEKSESEESKDGKDENMEDIESSSEDEEMDKDRTPTASEYGGAGKVWFSGADDDLTPLPSPKIGAIMTELMMDPKYANQDAFQEKVEAARKEREDRTVKIVKEQLEDQGAKEVGEDVDMEDEWMEKMGEKEWQELTKEAMEEYKARGGNANQKDEVKRALESEIEKEKETRKEKRKRSKGDVGNKDLTTAGTMRIIANTKRAITSRVVTGLMASKHASITSVDKGKGKEETRTRTPEKGEPSRKKPTMEERMEALERRTWTLGRRVTELEDEVKYWKGRTAAEGNKGGSQRPSAPRMGPATIPNSIPLSYAQATNTPSYQAPDNQWNKVEREREAGRKAREADFRRRVAKEKEDEIKNRGAVVINLEDAPIAGKNLSQEELIKKAVSIGVNKDDIHNVQTTINGNLRITVKPTTEPAKVVTQLTEKNVRVRTLESWAGIVVGGWRTTEWDGKMGDLRTLFEESWGIKLMREPRWLSNDKTRGPGKEIQSVVVHVAKASERETILNSKWFRTQDDEGYTMSKKQQGFGVWMREFTRNGGTSKKVSCTKCTEEGHRWWECKNLKKCGHCGKGHSSWEHAVRNITGDTNPKPTRN